MNYTTTLQIPMTADLRKLAEEVAENSGFSSVQEMVRIWMKGLKGKVLSIYQEPKPVMLSRKAIKRYNKMIDDIDSGRMKTRTFDDTDKLMEYLNS